MREFFINDPPGNIKYEFDTNYIKTTKYNALTFLPLSILYQFTRFANIYFLGISILCFFPSISPFSPLSSGVPFLFVLLCSVFRDGLEDYSRYKSDKGITITYTHIIRNKQAKGPEGYSWWLYRGDLLLRHLRRWHFVYSWRLDVLRRRCTLWE